MGYDDEFRVAKTMVPALTTMALPLREMGASAMTALLPKWRRRRTEKRKNDGGGGTGPEALVPCRLVVRDSTGPVPAGR